MKNLKNVFKVLLFTLSLLPFTMNAQSSQNKILKELRKGKFEELGKKEIKLNGEDIPIYSPELKRVRGLELLEYFQKNEYMIDPYFDNNKNVKLFVLRKATEEEKTKIKVNTEVKETYEEVYEEN